MALDFDGVDDKVDHGDVSGFDSATVLSIMFWYRATAIVSADSIFSKGVALKALQETGVNGVRISDLVGWNAYIVTADMPTAASLTWIHLAITFDSSLGPTSRIKAYKDGVQLTLTVDAAQSIGDGGANGLVFGGPSGGSETYADISLAHVRLYLAALTANEILQEMNSYRPVRTANLSLWSPYDDGTSARDYSGLSNHGTVTGALQVAGPPVSGGARVLAGRHG